MEGGDGAEKAGVNETAASARRRGANEATSHPNSINRKRRIQYRAWALEVPDETKKNCQGPGGASHAPSLCVVAEAGREIRDGPRVDQNEDPKWHEQ